MVDWELLPEDEWLKWLLTAEDLISRGYVSHGKDPFALAKVLYQKSFENK